MPTVFFANAAVDNLLYHSVVWPTRAGKAPAFPRRPSPRSKGRFCPRLPSTLGVEGAPLGGQLGLRCLGKAEQSVCKII